MHVNVFLCVCLSGVGGYSGGALIGMSELHGVYMCEGEKGKRRGGSQSAAAERVSRCYCMSPRPMNLQQERDNIRLDAFPLPTLICFGCFLWGFWFKETIDGSQVKSQCSPPLPAVSTLKV